MTKYLDLNGLQNVVSKLDIKTYNWGQGVAQFDVNDNPNEFIRRINSNRLNFRIILRNSVIIPIYCIKSRSIDDTYDLFGVWGDPTSSFNLIQFTILAVNPIQITESNQNIFYGHHLCSAFAGRSIILQDGYLDSWKNVVLPTEFTHQNPSFSKGFMLTIQGKTIETAPTSMYYNNTDNSVTFTFLINVEAKSGTFFNISITVHSNNVADIYVKQI